MAVRSERLNLNRFAKTKSSPDSVDASGALNSYGLRIERMLYVGVLILVACLVEVYLVNASVNLVSGPAKAVSELKRKISDREKDLLLSFAAEEEANNAPVDQKRLEEVEKMRAYLGIEASPESEKRLTKFEYRAKLKSIVFDVSYDAHVPSSDIEALIDATKSPSEIIKDLEIFEKSVEKKSVAVWGIEMPTKLSLKYAGSDLGVSIKLIAELALIVLAPVIFAWLGSFHITRQRELLFIRKATDYKLSFPHILNIVPVVFPDLIKKYKIGEDELESQKKVTTVILSGVRALMVLSLCAPMVIIFGLSSYMLFDQLSTDFRWIFGTFSFLVTFVISVQMILLVVQEVTILWGKFFDEYH